MIEVLDNRFAKRVINTGFPFKYIEEVKEIPQPIVLPDIEPVIPIKPKSISKNSPPKQSESLKTWI